MSSPSARLIVEAAAKAQVRDAEGRLLEVRRMTALDRLRLFKAVGPSLAHNAPYLGMAMLASSVTSIDDVPVPPPTTEVQLEALIAKLGDAGISAAASALSPEADQMDTHTPGN